MVDFIVRAVDDILKTEFNLPQGLADTSKTTIIKKEYTKATADRRSKLKEVEVEEEIHKVQILDPATGTGTFLAEVVKHIHKKFQGQQGIWSNYVENHLLPRLNGFELLMASYAMAHLKLDLLLKETGYDASLRGAKQSQRLRVYLTNSLEESHPDTGTLFANWLSTEANEANHIKRDTPVMCVIGNPPYAVSSTNKNDWIDNLIADYKKDLNEKSYNSLSDDYVKFIRYGQHYIEKNGSGVLAYISNNSFVDGIVFRKMRENLLECFDKIYILDLHGNSKKKEVCPDGSPDQNVFDIMQGVSINILIKTGEKKKNELSQVFNFDLFGKRQSKYNFLNSNELKSLNWKKLKCEAPNYFFVMKDFEGGLIYNEGFGIDEIFSFKASGMVGGRDSIVISFESDFNKLINDFNSLSIEEIRNKYNLKDSRDWILKNAINDIRNTADIQILTTMYKAFDKRFVLYTGNTRGIVQYPRKEMVREYINKNYGLSLMRNIIPNDTFSQIMVVDSIIDKNFYSFQTYNFPLYIYPETNPSAESGQSIQQTIEHLDTSASSLQGRIPNLKPEIVNQIAESLGLNFTNEKVPTENTFAPIDILDYIYAVLHSPTFRSTYKEFLKIDFPRVSYPKDQETFWQLVKLGGEIRQIHLLESPKVEQYITQYPVDGDNVITRKITKNSPGYVADTETHGKVYINNEQYFDHVPLVAWEFYIGGYQPAQKWLKDRKGRQLEFDDILHYQKIIVALTETDRLMKEIDKIETVIL